MFFFISDCCSHMSQENYRIEELCVNRFNIWNSSVILVWSGNTVLVSWHCSLLVLCAEHKSLIIKSSYLLKFYQHNFISILVFESSSIWNTLKLLTQTDTFLWVISTQTQRHDAVLNVVDINEQLLLIMFSHNLHVDVQLWHVIVLLMQWNPNFSNSRFLYSLA